MKSIILIAPPAAGKGTEAEKIKADFNELKNINMI